MSHTITTSDTTVDEPAVGTRSYLTIVLEASRPWAGGQCVALDGRSQLTVRRGALGDRATRVGEGAIVMPDRRLSSPHARFVLEDGRWIIEDLESKNGTFVGGVRVARRPLRDGDVIEVGASFLFYRLASAERFAADLDQRAVALQTLSPRLGERFRELERVAPSRQTILVRGETGTGKELTARAIHALSRRPGPFIAVNCGALPETLVEAELFGARKGAYSGATEEREGFVRAAHRGTLFLDEIAELSEPSQVALLRVLQQGEVVPVGASVPVPVDVRFVAATHQNLEARIGSGRFREDLLARLTGFTLHLPPLRERREDLGQLIAGVLRDAVGGRATSIELRRLAARALVRYGWPRNIRELDNALRSALLLADAGPIGLQHLPEPVAQGAAAGAAVVDGLDLRQPEVLRRRLVELYRRHNGNVSAVARELGKARAQIQRWNKRLEIDPDSYRS